MKPQSLKEAFEMLDHPVGYFPFTAIEYLQKHPLTNELEEKILFSLTNINNSTGTSLFYTVVAEEHLSKKFIEPLIAIFTTYGFDDIYDQLYDEANYLLQKFTEKYPHDVMGNLKPAFEKAILTDANVYYSSLYDMFQYVDPKEYTPWFIKIMQYEKFMLKDFYLRAIIYLGIPETISPLRDVLDNTKWNRDEEIIEELNYLFEKLVKGEFPVKAPTPDIRTRERWKRYYMDAKEHKLTDEEVEALSRIDTPIYLIDKRERKTDCYCGKTDKNGDKFRYKDCCFEKDAAIVNLPRFTQLNVSKKVSAKSVFAP